MELCSFSECGAPVEARKLCTGHYTQMRRGKALAPIRRYSSLEDRFWDNANAPNSNGCMIWRGKVRDRSGYGVVSMGSRTAGEEYAHRVSYSLSKGAIPDGALIDHVCHTKLCVNPEHLRISNYKLNNENRSGANKNSTSKARGVYPYKDTGRWAVQVTHNRRRYSGGTHATVEEAERAAMALRNSLFTHNDLDRIPA